MLDPSITFVGISQSQSNISELPLDARAMDLSRERPRAVLHFISQNIDLELEILNFAADDIEIFTIDARLVDEFRFRIDRVN